MLYKEAFQIKNWQITSKDGNVNSITVKHLHINKNTTFINIKELEITILINTTGNIWPKK